MSEINVSTGYEPRQHQRELHKALKRFNVLICHRRFGKTILCINELIDRCLSEKKKAPRFAYLAPLYRQAKTVAWDAVKEYTRAIPGTKYYENELRADLPNGGRITLFGADNYDSLRGLYLDGVVLDEYAQMSPRAWSEVIRPALADRLGWAIFIGTPKGRNQLYDIYDSALNGFKIDEDGTREIDPDWYAALYKASETGILPKPELVAARRIMEPEEYDQEFECSFSAALVGAYYGRLMSAADDDGRVTKVAYDPALPVETWWDLGIGDSTVVFFAQRAGPEIRIIDYYEASGVGLAHYAKVLQEKPYVYGTHVAPHDIEVRELGSGKSRKETAANLGIKFEVAPKLSIDDGIEAVRNLIPRCYFDIEKCDKGIEALRQYRKDWDEKGHLFRPRPLHDWTSHAADAFRYGAVHKPSTKRDDSRKMYPQVSVV